MKKAIIHFISAVPAIALLLYLIIELFRTGAKFIDYIPVLTICIFTLLACILSGVLVLKNKYNNLYYVSVLLSVIGVMLILYSAFWIIGGFPAPN